MVEAGAVCDLFCEVTGCEVAACAGAGCVVLAAAEVAGCDTVPEGVDPAASGGADSLCAMAHPVTSKAQRKRVHMTVTSMK